MTALHPSRYELLTDIVAASIPATTIPRTPGWRMSASMAGIAWIGSSVCPSITGCGTPLWRAPVP
jgi:hypothetical protein